MHCRNLRWLALIVLVLAAGCASDIVRTAAVPIDEVPTAEVDPSGTNQIISYTRNRSDQRMYLYVETASSSGGGLLGGIGCQAVGYPWTIRVGPDDRNPRANRVVLLSGSATRGTATIWIDVSPEGEILAGSGRPDWSTAAAASNCGE
jgi:hypothetical protein